MGYGQGRGRRRANPWLLCPKAGCCDDKGQRSYSYLPQIEKNEGKCPRCKAHWSKADLAWVRGQAAPASPAAKPAAQPMAAAPPSVPSVGSLTPQQLQARLDAAAADGWTAQQALAQAHAATARLAAFGFTVPQGDAWMPPPPPAPATPRPGDRAGPGRKAGHALWRSVVRPPEWSAQAPPHGG